MGDSYSSVSSEDKTPPLTKGRKVAVALGDLKSLVGDVMQNLDSRNIIFLSGDLGTGKTTFVQQLARVLGVVENVTSPSFGIVHECDCNYEDFKKLIHVDLYRLEANAKEDPSVRDVLDRANEDGVLIVIEWADRLGDVTLDALRLTFDYGEAEDERVVTFS